MSPGAADFCSRWRISWSATNVRSKLAEAGTSLALSASSEGRKIGTPVSELPLCRRRIAFQLPCTGIGSVVR